MTRHAVAFVSRKLFGAAYDWQVAHPVSVMRFYPALAGVPDWVEVDSQVALYELVNGRILRTRVTAEHTEGQTTALRAHGATAHVTTHGIWMLSGINAVADVVALRRAWLQSLKRRPRRFEPDLRGSSVHATVDAALENYR